MTEHKVQSHEALRQEMKAVARGEKRAPADAARPSFEPEHNNKFEVA